MFGWEFPPHISGGLGTACFGLTQSLLQENIELLFVVPKAHGDEPASTMQIINASEIPLPELERNEKKSRIQTVETVSRKTVRSHPVIHETKISEQYSTIEIRATLDPYSISTTTTNTHTINRWNYEFTPGSNDVVETTDVTEVVTKEPGSPVYQFSGTYGPQLSEEVDRYADVGKQLARSYSFDVIHAHDWMTFPAGIMAKKESGKPLIVHVHATEVDRSGISFGKVYDIERKGMEEADCIVAVSEWTKNIIIQYYGIPEEKIQVVHNGIIPKNQVSQFSESTESRMVTFVGRVTLQKGPRYFVEAARKVLDKFPDTHFAIVGSGDLLPQTIDRVAQLKMSRNFHFTGFLNNELINKIWMMSNLYVMPSVSEPFGITPLEAMQAGVPVIISKQSGVSEILPHALKVNFWDTDALAEAICSVLQYQSLSAMLKEKGQKEIQRLTWEKSAKKLTRIYHAITV